MISGLGRVFRGLGRNPEALSDLVTNLRRVTGAFAAEDAALAQAIERLPDFLAEGRPAFTALNRALPSVRAFAREALPGTLGARDAARGAAAARAGPGADVERELRGLVAELRPTVPQLAEFSQRSVEFWPGRGAFSLLLQRGGRPVVQRPSNRPPTYPHELGGRVFETTGYGLAGIAGESRSGDAATASTCACSAAVDRTRSRFRRTPARRRRAPRRSSASPRSRSAARSRRSARLEDSAKTPFKPKQPCEQQEPPDLGATLGAVPPQSTTSAPASPPIQSIYERYAQEVSALAEVQTLRDDGQEAAARRLENQIGDELDQIQADLQTELGQTEDAG